MQRFFWITSTQQSCFTKLPPIKPSACWRFNSYNEVQMHRKLKRVKGGNLFHTEEVSHVLSFTAHSGICRHDVFSLILCHLESLWAAPLTVNQPWVPPGPGRPSSTQTGSFASCGSWVCSHNQTISAFNSNTDLYSPEWLWCCRLVML